MKHKLFLVSMMSLLSISILSGCSNAHVEEHIDNPKDFVESNLQEEHEHEKVDKLEKIKFSSSKELSNYTIIDNRYRTLGILVLKNKTGHIGFYSLNHSVFIEECSYYYEWLDYEIRESNNCLFIKIDYENRTKIIDNLGNVIYSGRPISSWSVSVRKVRGIVYLSISTGGYYKNYMYENGLLYPTNFLPNEEDELPDPDTPDIDDDFDNVPTGYAGELFKEGNIIELDTYGNPGYYLNCSSTGITTLFEKETDRAINTFLVPAESSPIIAAKAIYYQQSYPLAEDNENFSYYDGNTKYALSTFKIDMYTGVQSLMDFKFVINSAEPCKGPDGLFNNSIVELQAINEYDTLNKERTVILNDQLQIIKDYTELQPQAFIRLSNGNYYNTRTKILYDSELNVITYLEYMNPLLFEDKGLFLGYYNGYYGLVDFDGKHVTTFKYKDVIYNRNSNYVLFSNDENDYFLYSLSSKSIQDSFYDCNLRIVDRNNYFYALESSNKLSFLSLDGTVKSFNGTYSFERLTFTNAINDFRTVNLEYRSNYGDINNYIFKYGDKEIRAKANGTENNISEKTGRSWDDAIVVKVGDNYIHSNPDNRNTILKFDPTITGVYNLNQLYSEVDIKSVSILKYKNYEYYFENTTFIGENQVVLEKGVSYYISISSFGYVPFSITLQSTSYDFTNSEESITSENYVVRSVKLTDSGYYKFDCSNLNYNIYSSNDGKLTPVHLNSYRYNGGSVYYLDSSKSYKYYFVMIKKESTAKFNLNIFDETTIPEIDSTELISINYQENILRIFNCTEDGYYLLNSNQSNYISTGVYYYDQYNESLREVSKITINNLNYYILSSDETYYVKAINSNSSYRSQIKLELTKLTYDTLPTMRLGIDSMYCGNSYGKFARKFSVETEGYYYFTNTNGSSNYSYKPSIYQLTEEGKLNLLVSKVINDKNLYHFVPTEKYFIYCDNYDRDFYQIESYQFTKDSLYKLDGSNKRGNGYFGFKSTKEGYYFLDEKDPYDVANVSLYEYNETTNEKTLIEQIEHKSVKYYKLKANQFYLVQAVSSSTYNYSLTLDYIIDDLNNLPPYKVTMNMFKSVEGGYSSTNKSNYSTSALTFTFEEDGTFKFLYDISSEVKYDKISVYKNGSIISVPNNSGSYTNQQMIIEVKTGDVITINYSKDSADSYGYDRLLVYGIEFVSALPPSTEDGTNSPETGETTPGV